ncbi:phage antirepressor KilAC domain-containing protein [Enterococcus avium]|uniref:phage antirepressor KilAC domain-containing protein n=1 Tax=Enterococcus avium TaxID=33945 RepID=UPI0028902318|nr:phage antirepressor KilAC domain-containing protein [Enterococcus avium]MDT2450613.1 phage antirepressor KilAC domain-containing protein [Enterococcus avium]
MNTPQIFNFEQNEVRTFLENDIPYFVANDVAKTLGYKNPSDATNKHCKKAVKTWGSDSLGRRQSFKVIPESDVYRLIIKSNLPSAEKFESWVMEEVLPQIRKHGMYATDELVDNPDLLIEVATKLKEEKTLRLIAEQRVNELKPKVLFADAVRGSTNSCLIKDLALMLNQNGINIGQNRLFAYMRKHKYLGSGKGHYNKPTQKSMDKDLFEYREHFHTNSSGEVEVRFTPLVTGKGQEYFVNEFLDSETA